MREIKFRAWDNKNKRWLSDDLAITLDGKKSVWIHGVHPHEEHGDISISQYTGLKDKTGKEIYEGDILKTRASQNVYVGYVDGGFALFEEIKDTHWHQHFCNGVYLKYYEVVGNIYENPELIPHSTAE